MDLGCRLLENQGLGKLVEALFMSIMRNYIVSISVLKKVKRNDFLLISFGTSSMRSVTFNFSW